MYSSSAKQSINTNAEIQTWDPDLRRTAIYLEVDYMLCRGFLCMLLRAAPWRSGELMWWRARTAAALFFCLLWSAASIPLRQGTSELTSTGGPHCRKQLATLLWHLDTCLLAYRQLRLLSKSHGCFVAMVDALGSCWLLFISPLLAPPNAMPAPFKAAVHSFWWFCRSFTLACAPCRNCYSAAHPFWDLYIQVKLTSLASKRFLDDMNQHLWQQISFYCLMWQKGRRTCWRIEQRTSYDLIS